MEGHAVHDRTHGVFADAEVNEAPGGVLSRQRRLGFQHGARVAGQIRATRHEARHLVEHGVERVGERHPSGHPGSRLPRGQGGLPSGDGASSQHVVPLGATIAQVGFEFGLPLLAGDLAGGPGLAIHLGDVVGYEEALIGGEAHHRLGGGDLLVVEGQAVGSGIVGELRRRVADVGADHHQCGGRRVGLGLEQTAFERIEVFAGVAQLDDVPPVGAEAGRGVIGEGQLGTAVDRHAVVVVDGMLRWPSPKWPASEAASWLTPSARSPSEQIPQMV